MNIRLLKRVRDYILAEPRRVNMAVWGDIRSGNVAPACGTVACIAGWTKVLVKRPNLAKLIQDAGKLDDFFDDADKVAKEKLGLSLNQAQQLFYVHHWPSPFETRYNRSRLSKQRARVVADRIDYFIATEGDEK